MSFVLGLLVTSAIASGINSDPANDSHHSETNLFAEVIFDGASDVNKITLIGSASENIFLCTGDELCSDDSDCGGFCSCNDGFCKR